MTPALLFRNALVAIGVGTAAAAAFGSTDASHAGARSQPSAAVCAAPWTPAAPRGTAGVVRVPAAVANARGFTGDAVLALALDARGRVTGAVFLTRSGAAAADAAALQAARGLRFAPETADCRPVAGAYVAELRFARAHDGRDTAER